MEKKVGIVVLNYNGVDTKFQGKPILTQTLDWLKKTNYSSYKTVVVDDASTDDSVERAKRYKVDIIALKKNLFNFAKSNNIGIRYMLKKYKPDCIVLLSNDVFLKDRNWLRTMLATLESGDDIGAVTCKQVYPTGKIQYAGNILGLAPRARGRGEPDKGQYDKIEDVELGTAVFCIIPTGVLKKVGLFDENFDFGSEDDDLFMRIRKAGFRILYNGKVAVTHLEGYASTASVDREKKDMTFFKNQVSFTYLVLKDYPFPKKLLGLGVVFGNSIFSIESKDRKRSIANLRFKDRPLWRLFTSFRAFSRAYGIWLRNRGP